MAKIEPKNGKYKLDDPKDTELEGIDNKKYNVYTDDEKLDAARKAFPHYNWFVSFSITDKEENVVRDLAEYTLKFDEPDAETFQLYYYLDQAANPLSYETEDKDGKKRVKAKLKIGDPPIGHYP